MRRTAHFRALAPIAVLALVAVTAAACGDDGGTSGTDDRQTVVVDENGDPVDQGDAGVEPLTEDQIAQAVLQSENLGDGWTSAPSTDDDSEAPGCLADIDTLTEGLVKKDKAGTEFDHGDALSVESTVTAYEDEVSLAAVFDQVQEAVAACTTVSGPDGDGNQWDITLATNTDALYDGVDDQYTLTASGTITTSDGTAVDVYLEQTAARLGPNVSSVSTFDISDRTTEHGAWTQIAVDRLISVANGEEPAATTAPAPA